MRVLTKLSPPAANLRSQGGQGTGIFCLCSPQQHNSRTLPWPTPLSLCLSVCLSPHSFTHTTVETAASWLEGEQHRRYCHTHSCVAHWSIRLAEPCFAIPFAEDCAILALENDNSSGYLLSTHETYRIDRALRRQHPRLQRLLDTKRENHSRQRHSR